MPVHIEQTPDSYGLIYLNGSPITGVSSSAKYSTPFSFANQDYIRPTLTDTWDVNDFLTINNRLSYTHRDIDAMRNNDSMSAGGTHIAGDFAGRPAVAVAGRFRRQPRLPVRAGLEVRHRFDPAHPC